MALSLNVPSAPHAFYSLSIEQTSYKFTFRWQTRTRAWYISVEDGNGVPLVNNAKLVPNVPLFRQNLNNAPSGNLYVIKKTEDSVQIAGRTNIGPNKDFELVYLTAEELAR